MKEYIIRGYYDKEGVLQYVAKDAITRIPFACTAKIGRSFGIDYDNTHSAVLKPDGSTYRARCASLTKLHEFRKFLRRKLGVTETKNISRFFSDEEIAQVQRELKAERIILNV